jgi:hypothetical protein
VFSGEKRCSTFDVTAVRDDDSGNKDQVRQVRQVRPAPPFFNSKTLHLIVTSCSGRPSCGAEAAPFAPNIHLSLLLPYAALVRGTPVGHAPHAAPPYFNSKTLLRIAQRIAQHLPCHCSCIPPAQGALAVVLRRHLLHPTSTSPCFCHTLLSCAARRLVTPLTALPLAVSSMNWQSG